MCARHEVLDEQSEYGLDEWGMLVGWGAHKVGVMRL